MRKTGLRIENLLSADLNYNFSKLETKLLEEKINIRQQTMRTLEQNGKHISSRCGGGFNTQIERRIGI